ncbi:MAG: serine hydrolase domain-containing protein [Bacilli bacterium]
MHQTEALHEKLEQCLDKVINHRLIEEVTLHIANTNGTFQWEGVRGNVKPDDSYYIASTTKLFTTALIYRAIGDRKLALNHTIGQYVSSDRLAGLNIQKGIDLTLNITIQHLLTHTSGIADYFQGKLPDGTSLYANAIKNNDQQYDFDAMLRWAKAIGGQFEPGKGKKALYSDTNYQLLGKVVEVVYDMSYTEALHAYILAPLGMNDTRMFTADAAPPTLPLRYKETALDIPHIMGNFQSDGGVISTNRDMIAFSTAFWTGELFPDRFLDEMTQEWRNIFFPLQYSRGVMRYRMPSFMTSFVSLPLVGHSGLSGAFVWYSKELDLHFAGTVNQIANPDISYRFLSQVLVQCLKEMKK